MRLTDLFIKRPVFATCLNLLIFIAGYQAIQSLNVRQYPRSDNAVVTVKTIYVGASADLVRGFITTPLERVIASADGIDYLESKSAQSLSEITAHLRLNFDTNDALTQIQAKVAQVRNDLPPEAQAPVIGVESSDNRFASMYLSFYSKDQDQNQITDYLTRVVQPQISAIPGVERADILGARIFAMRIWLKPDRMAALNLSASDVQQALAANNFLSALGNTKGSMITVNLLANTDLRTTDEFKHLVVKRSGDTLTRLEDIADISLGAESYDEEVRFNGEAATFMGVWVLPNANSLDVIRRVREVIPDIEARLPTGLKVGIPYDATAYIEDSLHEVFKTLLETIAIVILVIFLFIGSLRAVIVPVVAIPLSLVGAASLMLAFGFSINLLTLLAIVLAVGLVVDDAIVMLENIERHIAEGETPINAALNGARELIGPTIAMTITLAAVYAPIGIQGGLTGTLFREFAFTLAGAVVISGVVALTLSPMMSSKLLKAHEQPSKLKIWVDGKFEALRTHYLKVLRASLKLRPQVLMAAIIFMLCIVPFYMFATKELAPREDQGIIFSIIQASPNSSLDQTTRYANKVIEAYRSFPEFSKAFQLTQPSFGFSGMLVKPWSQRSRTVMELEGEAWGKMSQIPGVRAIVTTPAPLPGGSDFPIEFVISSTSEPAQIAQYAGMLVGKAFESGVFMFADSDLKFDLPQSEVVIDRDKAAVLGLNMQQVGTDLNVLLGGNYINRFSIQGRSYKVIPQVKRESRLNPEQLQNMYVSGPKDSLIPLSTIAKIENSVQPRQLNRFQQLNSAKIQGAIVPGVSIDQGLKVLEEAATKILPKDFILDYAGESRQLRKEQNSMLGVIILSLGVIFLVLASQFESFRDPLIVLGGSVPLALAGALMFVFLGFTSLNIYSQVGLVTLVGLVAKNGILIVEFANKMLERGLSAEEAVVAACSTRLRPILMTSVATVAGHFPLILASGAGAGARNSIGIVLVSGMIIGTFFTLVVVPNIYLLIARKKQIAESSERTKLGLAGQALSLWLVPLLCLSVLSSCAIGPDYTTPETATPTEFSEGKLEQVSQEKSIASWWKNFGDEQLTTLIQRAIDNNKDIDAAVARLEQARITRRDATTDLLPEITNSAGYNKSRQSTARQNGFPGPRDSTVYSGSVDTSWEIDFWGRVRRKREQKIALEDSAEASLQDVLRLVAAEVADSYFSLRGAQVALSVAKQNADSQAITAKLTKDMLDIGEGAELNFVRAQSQLDTTKASIPPLEAEVKAHMFRIAVLLGQNPESMYSELAEDKPIPLYQGPIRIGSPAELLARRPDVRAAERQLAAATANIGVAMGNYLPKVTFVGSVGLEAMSISKISDSGSDAYSFGPNIFWPAFGLGRVYRLVKAADAQTDEALATYEKQILLALEDTENSLANFAATREQRSLLKSSSTNSTRAAELAKEQYQAGAIDFLTLLEAERQKLTADVAFSNSETALARAYVRIFKALGGGWEEFPIVK